jgi:outer membrane protein OmpA-like peptidoglycan-associated protein/tetratricopeptide (TPR) repeat protein
MKQKLRFLFILILGLTPHSWSQDDPCGTDDKKIRKLLTEALAANDFTSQTAQFGELMRKYPNHAESYYYYAQLCYQQASFKLKADPNSAEGEGLLKKSIVFYQTTTQKCPSFHSDCYYYCGKVLYNYGEDQKALPFLEKFLVFDSINPTGLSESYATQKAEIQSIVDDLKFQQELVDNPVPFVPKKVGGVSSELDEYFPMISPDNDLLFYTRKVDRTNLGDIATNIREEFTISERGASDVLYSLGSPLPQPFNNGSFYNYGTASLSVDNREMIICACKVEKVYNKDYLNCDLYTTSYTRSGRGGNDFKWTPLVNMGSNINTKDGWEAQPSLSADGKLLFFATLRKGSRDNDIYYAEKQANGTWSVAKPFDIVNTAAKDKSPFFHQDGETLYFVSTSTKSRKGLGGLDIFYIRKEGDKWTEPKNIGYPINSAQDELGLFVSTSGKVAYFSTAKDGDWNIYAFDLYEEARPKEVVILRGELKDEAGNAVSNASIDITYNETGETVNFKVNAEDGKYATVVKVDQKQDITLSVNKENFAFQAQTVSSEQLQNRTERHVEVKAMQVDSLVAGKPYTIADILYTTDSYELNKAAKVILIGFAKYLQSNPSLNIRINGHTDDLGNEDSNLQLSQARAEEVKRFLSEKGVSAERMTASGFGESMPRVANEDTESRAMNRRTEFEIVE